MPIPFHLSRVRLGGRKVHGARERWQRPVALTPLDRGRAHHQVGPLGAGGVPTPWAFGYLGHGTHDHPPTPASTAGGGGKTGGAPVPTEALTVWRRARPLVLILRETQG